MIVIMDIIWTPLINVLNYLHGVPKPIKQENASNARQIISWMIIIIAYLKIASKLITMDDVLHVETDTT